MVWGELVFWKKKYAFKRWEELFVGKRKEKYPTRELSWAAAAAAQEAEQALGWPVKVEVGTHSSRYCVLSDVVVRWKFIWDWIQNSFFKPMQLIVKKCSKQQVWSLTMEVVPLKFQVRKNFQNSYSLKLGIPRHVVIAVQKQMASPVFSAQVLILFCTC